jgi:hypothetical protein
MLGEAFHGEDRNAHTLKVNIMFVGYRQYIVAFIRLDRLQWLTLCILEVDGDTAMSSDGHYAESDKEYTQFQEQDVLLTHGVLL